jgi:hypothetical protein
MEQVFRKMMAKAIHDLEILERKGYIQFKVFTKEGDEEYGNLKAVAPKKQKTRTRAASQYPIGEVRTHILQYVENLQPDNIASIPVGKYNPENVRGNVCSWCTVKWGKGTYSSTYNKANQTIEVYRHAV